MDAGRYIYAFEKLLADIMFLLGDYFTCLGVLIKFWKQAINLVLVLHFGDFLDGFFWIQVRGRRGHVLMALNLVIQFW